MKKRPNVLTIAGFDPTSGAGLTADIKTLEALKCYGLGICTANTIQNDVAFQKCFWINIETIKNQISVLFDRFTIDYVKIGIVENWRILNAIVDFVLKHNFNAKIIVDPVLKSSSGFGFQNVSALAKQDNKADFESVLDKIYLLTPNYEEIQKLYEDKNIEETITHISGKTNVYLKGGHREETIGKDELFTKEGKHYALSPKMKNISEKHGSGCILSSAITAQLSLGFPLLKSCYRAKRYTEKVLSSNVSLLGYHRM